MGLDRLRTLTRPRASPKSRPHFDILVRLGRDSPQDRIVWSFAMKQRAWIKIIEPAEAKGELARVYSGVGARDDVASILAVQSLDPHALLAHHELYRGLMYGPSP